MRGEGGTLTLSPRSRFDLADQVGLVYAQPSDLVGLARLLLKTPKLEKVEA
jgi:hypothetical protein